MAEAIGVPLAYARETGAGGSNPGDGLAGAVAGAQASSDDGGGGSGSGPEGNGERPPLGALGDPGDKGAWVLALIVVLAALALGAFDLIVRRQPEWLPAWARFKSSEERDRYRDF